VNIRVTAGSTRVTHTLREHIERRLGLALGRHAARIRSVAVTFSNQGPKMKMCRIAVTLRRDVSVEAAGVDMFTAVDLAADHVTRRVARAIETEATEAATKASRAALARRGAR
jgi:ribosomal subunit interface protein